MPFNAQGVYTPPTGATDAAPGDVIRSATWNSIFQDVSDALTLMGQQVYGSTAVTAASYAPVASDALLFVNRAGAVAINLPSAASRGQYPLTIKDISGAANTNNITINRNGSDTIDGATSLVIDVGYGTYKLVAITGGWAIVP